MGQATLHAMRAAAPLFCLALLALGCSKDKSDDGKPGSEEADYTASGRGVVKHIAVGPEKTALTIHHEAFPDWVSRSGKKAPMMSMSMEFQAGAKLDVGSLSASDKIGFDVAVYYGDGARMVITSFKKLPPDTALELAGH
jgi:hypothetical protein